MKQQTRAQVEVRDVAAGLWRLTQGRKVHTVKVHGSLSSNDGEVVLDDGGTHHGPSHNHRPVRIRVVVGHPQVIGERQNELHDPAVRMPTANLRPVLHHPQRQVDLVSSVMIAAGACEIPGGVRFFFRQDYPNMRYLVVARVKPGRNSALARVIDEGTLGKGSVAGDEYLDDMEHARLDDDGTVRWVEVCFCPTPLAEERPYWEEYFELLSVKDAHSRKNCRDLNGQEAWACCNCA